MKGKWFTVICLLGEKGEGITLTEGNQSPWKRWERGCKYDQILAPIIIGLMRLGDTFNTSRGWCLRGGKVRRREIKRKKSRREETGKENSCKTSKEMLAWIVGWRYLRNEIKARALFRPRKYAGVKNLSLRITRKITARFLSFSRNEIL